MSLQALNVPLPPPKEAKPSVEGAPEKTKAELIPEDCEDSRKQTSPETPRSSQLRGNGLGQNSQPPLPPTQDTKPPVVSDQVPDGMGENPKSPVAGQESGELSEEGGPHLSRSPGEQRKKPPCPLVPPKKKPEKLEKAGAPDGLDKPDPAASNQAAPELSVGLCEAEEPLPKNQVPSVLVSWMGSLDDELIHDDEEHKAKAEEKSVDSGQHSDDDSDGSRSGDTLAVSTAAMRGSLAGLDAMDSSQEDLPSLSCSGTLAGTRASSTGDPCQSPEADPRGKTSTKAKSASFGDLLSECAVGPHCHDVRKLQAEICLEIQKTTELLSKAPQRGAGEAGGDLPESLLDKAMEKLQKAERVLREAQKLKSAAPAKRMSW